MIRFVVLVLFALVTSLCTPPTARAAATTNYSDQWLNLNESGWGAAVLQQGQILFIDVFVYGLDTKPTWFTVAAFYQGATAQGHLIFSGDLYLNNGPYFGGPFNAGPNVTNRKVGTLTFDSDTINTASISYSVDGVNVTKSVTRQLWSYENFAGSYYGGLILDYTNCSNAGLNGHSEELGALSIAHSASNTLSIAFNISGVGACTFTAPYTQAGHMGAATGTYVCANGVGGTLTAFELEKTISGITGRLFGANQFCQFSGRLGGLLR